MSQNTSSHHQNLRAEETPGFRHGGKARGILIAVPLSRLDK